MPLNSSPVKTTAVKVVVLDISLLISPKIQVSSPMFGWLTGAVAVAEGGAEARHQRSTLDVAEIHNIAVAVLEELLPAWKRHNSLGSKFGRALLKLERFHRDGSSAGLFRLQRSPCLRHRCCDSR